MRRAVTVSAASAHAAGAFDGLGEYDPEKLKIVGTCGVVEKSYFRLTSAPDPATVRPEPVLALALADLKRKFRSGGVECVPTTHPLGQTPRSKRTRHPNPNVCLSP